MQYFFGEFNGIYFIFFDFVVRFINFGKDDYVGQFFYDEFVSIGWVFNWQYINFVFIGEEGWRSVMILLRKNYFINIIVVGWDFVQEVYDFFFVFGN